MGIAKAIPFLLRYILGVRAYLLSIEDISCKYEASHQIQLVPPTQSTA
jgi:hypothetical protein